MAERTVLLTEEELKELGTYNCSLPTGTRIGKRWKKDRNYYRPNGPHEPDWWMAEYVEDPDPKMVGIEWSRVLHPCRVEGCGRPTWGNKRGGLCSRRFHSMVEV